MKVIVLAVLVSSALAACPNDCGGHGVCGLSTQCECYRNWYGADCSLRVCSFGRAFVDSPVGDLNGDGSLNPSRSFDPSTNSWVEAIEWVSGGASELYDWQYAYARSDRTSAWDEAHFYRECSNKGTCDRDTGICDCFPGYEGEGCARTSCANDCSGHGVCKLISDFADADYFAWDSDKTQVCECDAGYTGPDCSLRQCPRGADPVKYAQTVTNSVQGIYWQNPSVTGASDVEAAQDVPTTVYYTVAFTDEFGDSWTTSMLSIVYSSSCTGGTCDATVDYATHPLDDQVEALNNSLGALPSAFSSIYTWGIDATSGGADADTYPSSTNANGDSVFVDSLDYRLDTTMVSAATAAGAPDCTAATTAACFFVKINNPGKQSALQVNWWFRGEADVDGAVRQLRSVSGSTTGFASSANAGGSLLDMVTVWDVQEYRDWNAADGDVEYEFIEEGIWTGDADTSLDYCSKRGTCDFDTGLCDCFSGYSGLRCDDQNAIAYSY